GLDDVQYGREQLLPTVGSANPDCDEVGADEHVGEVVELREQSDNARIIDLRRGLIPAARSSMGVAGDKPNCAWGRGYLWHDRPVDWLISNRRRAMRPFFIDRRGRDFGVREFEPERAVAPAEAEVEPVAELVAPPSLARPDELGQFAVVIRRP